MIADITNTWRPWLTPIFEVEILPREHGTAPLVIIVAEDEAALRMLAVAALAGEGFVTLEAANAADVIAICESQANEIDALFTDIQMPGSMDGVALARHVRERWPSIAVVVTSGNVSGNAVALPAGARFVPKPYDIERVVEVIRELRPPRGVC